jgi:hypothetical protein
MTMDIPIHSMQLGEQLNVDLDVVNRSTYIDTITAGKNVAIEQ